MGGGLLDAAGAWLVKWGPHIRCHPRTHDGQSWIRGPGHDQEAVCYPVHLGDSEYMSAWYTSPQQHVLEALVSVVLLVPLAWYCISRCMEALARHRGEGKLAPKRAPLLHKVWGALLLASVLGQLWFKSTATDISSHPAYLAQPCHMHSAVMALTAFSDAEWSHGVLHVAATLWWGPFLAFVAPDLPAPGLEVLVFWVQHTLMMLVIVSRWLTGSRWMYVDFWWNALGFVFLCAYHFWFLAPVSYLTGVNVATMMVPPEPLTMFGSWYRPVWTACCGLLQVMSVVVLSGGAKLLGLYPSATTDYQPKLSNGNANGAHKAKST